MIDLLLSRGRFEGVTAHAEDRATSLGVDDLSADMGRVHSPKPTSEWAVTLSKR